MLPAFQKKNLFSLFWTEDTRVKVKGQRSARTALRARPQAVGVVQWALSAPQLQGPTLNWFPARTLVKSSAFTFFDFTKMLLDSNRFSSQLLHLCVLLLCIHSEFFFFCGASNHPPVTWRKVFLARFSSATLDKNITFIGLRSQGPARERKAHFAG